MANNSQDISNDNDALHSIYTVPNIITMVRLMLIPFAFTLLIQGSNDVLAFIIFALAGASDFVDGQIARRTNQVSELGKALDPLVDRFLLAAGIIGLYVVGRVPLWILCVLIGRDFVLFCGVMRLKMLDAKIFPVIFLGKLTTALLLVGFSGLIVNLPKLHGLNIADATWLPGLNGQPVSIWIYFVYIGMIFSLITAGIYLYKGMKSAQVAKTKH